MIGSANIQGSKAMHIMTGNLSHQIEHHLFPDLPSNRYAQIAPRVQEICTRYGLDHAAAEDVDAPSSSHVASMGTHVAARSALFPGHGAQGLDLADPTALS